MKFDPLKDNANPQWAIIAGQYLISPIYGGNGRVIVQEDPFTSKYDCSQCGGAGHLGVVCQYCKGTTYHKGKEENGACRDCNNEAQGPLNKSLGFVPCPTCHGRGGTIVVPDESKKNTTTGQVLAISDREVVEVKVGDKVMFTNYSGSPFKFLNIDLRIIIEKDLLAKVKKLKSNVDGINEGSFAELDNVGIVR